MKIGVVITSFGPIDQQAYHNHLSVLMHWNKQYDLICYHLGDNQQESSLNGLTEVALKDECDYVLYLEHDNIYYKEMLADLLKHDVDIVSGYYTYRNWPFAPIPLKKDAVTGLIYQYEYATGDPTKENLIEMDVACFGCCLVKRKVLIDLQTKKKNFRREYHTKTGSSLTADVVFFGDCQMLDYKVHVDGNVRVGHLSNRFVITPDNFRIFREMVKLTSPGMVGEEERLTDDQVTKVAKFFFADGGLYDSTN